LEMNAKALYKKAYMCLLPFTCIYPGQVYKLTTKQYNKKTNANTKCQKCTVYPKHLVGLGL